MDKRGLARGLVGASAILLAVSIASGCGTVGLSEAGDGNAASGEALFAQKCGTCHVLADAGTKGQIGPNLDDAFLQSRADGLGESTIQSVVRGQIEYPVKEPSTGTPGMPGPDTLLPECAEGREDEPRGCVADQNEAAEDIAAYVASVAGKPTAGTPASGADPGGSTPEAGAGDSPDGEAIFADAGCGGCHALEAAGASGNVGPSLDESKPTKELVIERVTKGMGAMPSFADSYTPEEIVAVADYVVSSTGGR
ncbi:MAG: c-type cytochrome [Gaiellaceae bacterium MAG52_C11]|nr:c-type cytochrome [Candidatus Gaiellasilicea maunaloa]